jgi:hypothetical protein
MSRWSIASVTLTDEYGDAYPDRVDGRVHLPEIVHEEFIALRLVESTGIAFNELCNMRYDEFRKLALLNKARQWQPQTRNPREKYL